ncbi:MAG: peptidoglycan-binding domain-containing protein [Gammaproteobacteria bacterium]
MSNTIIMYWDRVDSLGDPIAGIEVDSYEAIEIPPDACGFRLGLPNHNWYEGWHFAAWGGLGSPFANGGIEYSSAFTGVPSPDAIVATGPVHACTSGSYMFQTPLAAFGISPDEPVIAGAGSFVADFSSEDDIEWLDSAGMVIPKPHPPAGEPKIPELPPEFFERLPRLTPCIRDFDQKLHCPIDASQASIVPDLDALTLAVAPPPGIALLVAAGSGILPRVKAIAAPAGEVNDTPHGSKLEVTCPAELVMTATFFKDHTFEPAIAAYRFRFAHGPVSTVFSTLVDKDGANTVFHSVPIPLPPPIGGTPGGGGGVPPGPGTVAVVVKPIEPINPGGSGPPTQSQEFTVEALPGNEHKGSVRVEVVNAFEGVVSSEWATYHLVCVPGSHRPGLLPGSLGVAVTSLQAGLNRWLKSQKMTPLKVDGVFGPRTEAAVRAFQKDRRLDVDGKVGTKTWREVLSQK